MNDNKYLITLWSSCSLNVDFFAAERSINIRRLPQELCLQEEHPLWRDKVFLNYIKT